MEADFWLERWQKDEIGFHQDLINPWLAYYYGEMGPPPEKRSDLSVFVPLCGKSKDILWLAQNGYQVIGVELSEVAVKDFFSESQLQADIEKIADHTQYTSNNIRLINGDLFECTKELLGGVTDVFDRASLVALPLEMRVRYVEKMAQLLTAGTRVLLVTLTYPQHEMDGPPFSVSEQEVQDLYSPYFKIDKLAVKNTLQDEPRFQQRGLTELTETAYKLTRL